MQTLSCDMRTLSCGTWDLVPCAVLCLVAQSCPILCDIMDDSPPGFSVHGSLQARILEGVTMPSSRASSRPMDQTQAPCIGRSLSHWTTRETPLIDMFKRQILVIENLCPPQRAHKNEQMMV